MIQTAANGIELYRFTNLSECNEIEHFITSRKGGYSTGNYEGLNLGFHTGDLSDHVLKNRQKLAETVGMPLQRFVFANQTHSSNVVVVGEEHCGMGATSISTAIADTDALITQKANICICVQTADCVPLLLFDPVQRVIAAVHAGWRGIVGGIVKNTIQKMSFSIACNPTDIVAGIGPANGDCCYEVGEDVVQYAQNLFDTQQGIILPSTKPDKYMFHQSQAVKQQLLDAGLQAHNIEESGFCTQCRSNTFFSSRDGKGNTGRIAGGIMLKETR
ncbi:MAG TPA: peptidoglycan editing factor PgeF [Bacteroidales bacterium]|nr:peptidoglycan editing factor PgeF [Bacteroidales bacterium]